MSDFARLQRLLLGDSNEQRVFPFAMAVELVKGIDRLDMRVKLLERVAKAAEDFLEEPFPVTGSWRALKAALAALKESGS